MAVKSGKRSVQNNANVSLSVIIGAAVVALLFLGFLAYRLFASNTGQAPPRALNANDMWVQQKATEVNGNFKRLSPQDQVRMIQTVGQNAAYNLKSYLPQK